MVDIVTGLNDFLAKKGCIFRIEEAVGMDGLTYYKVVPLCKTYLNDSTMSLNSYGVDAINTYMASNYLVKLRWNKYEHSRFQIVG